MLEAVSQLADLTLFILTVVFVGKRPQTLSVAVMIVLVAAVDFGFVTLVAVQEGMNPIEWYHQQLSSMYAVYAETLGPQAQADEGVISFVAGISPAIYMVQASGYVIVGLCIRWIADRIRGKSEWSAFSQVDLSIWWLMPLLTAIGLYIVSLFVQANAMNAVQLVAANLAVMSGIPLFVQGAAAGKGIMNKMGISLGLQIVLGVLGILSGVLFIVVPMLGLVDFWANFRKLPREDESSRAVKKAE